MTQHGKGHPTDRHGQLSTFSCYIPFFELDCRYVSRGVRREHPPDRDRHLNSMKLDHQNKVHAAVGLRLAPIRKCSRGMEKVHDVTRVGEALCSISMARRVTTIAGFRVRQCGSATTIQSLPKIRPSHRKRLKILGWIAGGGQFACQTSSEKYNQDSGQENRNFEKLQPCSCHPRIDSIDGWKN
jgi:hypothetical protein